MELSYLPGEYLIKTVKKNDWGGLDEEIFILRALRIKNVHQEQVSILELQFDLKSAGETQKLITYPKEILSEKAKQMSKFMEILGRKKSNPTEEQARKYEFENFLGQDPFWDVDRFTVNTELQPFEEIGYLLEVFKGYLTNPIDELGILVKFKINGEIKTSSVSVPIKTYLSKNEYILPLKGAWLVWGNWDVTTASHRTMHSQEFGMDFVQFNDDLMFPLVVKTKNEDFKTYKKDIFSVGDGEVIDVFDSAPENPNAPDMLSPEIQEEINKKYGLHATALGNYVIIKHPNNEYSCYAHLVTDSVVVKKGEKVQQGQVIGKVGNSGYSMAPHLHFQIMDGANFLTARGLPCQFSNIVDFLGKDISLIMENLTIVQTKESK